MRTLSVIRTGILILAGMLFLNPRPIRAQSASGNVLTEHAELVFRAKIKDSECKPLIAKNETLSDLVIEKIDLGKGSESFVLTDIVTLPMKLAPSESISLGYACFRPKIANKEYNSTLRIVFSPIGHPDDGVIRLHAQSFSEPVVPVVPPTSPGAIINFDPATIKNGTLLSMVGKDEEFFRSFNFKNVSSKTVTVSSIDFEKKDAKFDLSSVEPGGALPLDVAPGESFSVRIAYHSFERTPSFNTLLIYSDDSTVPVRYDIRGLEMPLSQMEWNQRSQASQQSKGH